MNEKDLVGNFTAQLLDKVLVFADENEAQKEGLGIIKALITEDDMRERVMYQNPRTRRSFLNIILASNDLYSTPQSSPHDRRFFILNADSKAYLSSPALKEVRGETEYFEYLRSSIENETVQKTFFHFLYKLPLNGFNPQVIPETRIAAQSSMRTIAPHERWWSDCILSQKNTASGLWKKDITATELFHCYLTFKYENAHRYNLEDIEHMAHNKAELELFLGKAENLWPRETKRKALRNTPGESEFTFPDYLDCKADWETKFRGFGLLNNEENNPAVETRRAKYMQSVTAGKLNSCFLPVKTGYFEARKQFLDHLLKVRNGQIEHNHSRDFLAHEYTNYDIRHGYHLIQSAYEPAPFNNIGTTRLTADVLSNALRELREQELLE